jgi:hypothetical protein
MASSKEREPMGQMLPNPATQEALADAERRPSLTTYGSLSELFADLGI